MTEVAKLQRKIWALTERALEIADEGLRTDNPEHTLTAKGMLEEVLQEMARLQALRESTEARESVEGQDTRKSGKAPPESS